MKVEKNCFGKPQQRLLSSCQFAHGIDGNLDRDKRRSDVFWYLAVVDRRMDGGQRQRLMSLKFRGNFRL
jgi:hypothetical protein